MLNSFPESNNRRLNSPEKALIITYCLDLKMSAPPLPPFDPAAPPIQTTPSPAPPIQVPPIPPLEGTSTNKTVAISVTVEVMKELAKIGAEYQLRDGNIRTLQEVIVLLIVEHKQALSE
jgi:hypothetical protein